MAFWFNFVSKCLLNYCTCCSQTSSHTCFPTVSLTKEDPYIRRAGEYPVNVCQPRVCKYESPGSLSNAMQARGCRPLTSMARKLRWLPWSVPWAMGSLVYKRTITLCIHYRMPCLSDRTSPATYTDLSRTHCWRSAADAATLRFLLGNSFSNSHTRALMPFWHTLGQLW